MGLLDGPLGAIFGAAFGALFRDGMLHKVRETAAPAGIFAVATTDYAVKVSTDAVGAGDRAASGLPLDAIRLTILNQGLPVSIDLDDGVSVGGVAYRIIRVETDPAGAGVVAAAVPA